MFIISKEFHFSASHQLGHLPDDHQCARLHGHNYIIRVALRGAKVNSDGFVQDYGELKPIKDYIDRQLDHRHLNNVLGNSWATTAENLAWHMYHKFKDAYPCLYSVAVSETPNTWATYVGP